ncbi:MAG: serine/threonine protein kinase [Planctomycetaceae bacterium]|nr:serine/threonine protein kinase [Planctomycetaceae bacterium]
MSASRRSTFRASTLLCGLVTREQLKQTLDGLRSEDPKEAPRSSVSDERLSHQLIEMGLLTSYQVHQLKAGHTKLTLGPYVITDWIGQGGMGQVYKAVHQVMGRESAIKVLPQDKSTPEAIASFQHEIRMQAQLDHTNLVRAFDAGHDGNVHYLVTEYVPGTDLRRLLRSQGPLTMQQAAGIVIQAAQGLDYAHQRGLIHRDVKPGNILVTPEGRAKVSDLGLSAFMHQPDEDPRAGKIVGTVDYLSPEQIRSPAEVTATSDIYSLGCTLYYAVTGKVPFPGGSIADKTRRHLDETPWHPRRFNPDLNEEYVEIIADMMEKDAAARIQTAADVASRLEPWAGDAETTPSFQMQRMSWMPPPLPIDVEDEDLQETNGTEISPSAFNAIEFHPSDPDSLSQQSQGTNPITSAANETVGNSRTSLPAEGTATEALYPSTMPHSASAVAIALAISIPVSLLVGTVVGLLLHALL